MQMPRAARPRKQKAAPTMTRVVAESVGGMIARNPAAVGGSTAFLVALFYVSANALWYQPYLHPQPLMVTRGYPDGAEESRRKPPEGTTFQIDREQAVTEGEAAAAASRPAADPTVRRVQAILKDLQFYPGTVDGLPGPATRRAIEQYQARVGMPVNGQIDAALLDQLDAGDTTAGIRPAEPTPREEQPALSGPALSGPALSGKERVSRIQAGLRAFGNAEIDVDGLPGPRTRAAVKEFQAMFGLAETGEPDDQVLAKMREVGLTN